MCLPCPCRRNSCCCSTCTQHLIEVTVNATLFNATNSSASPFNASSLAYLASLNSTYDYTNVSLLNDPYYAELLNGTNTTGALVSSANTTQLVLSGCQVPFRQCRDPAVLENATCPYYGDLVCKPGVDMGELGEEDVCGHIYIPFPAAALARHALDACAATLSPHTILTHPLTCRRPAAAAGGV